MRSLKHQGRKRNKDRKKEDAAVLLFSYAVLFQPEPVLVVRQLVVGEGAHPPPLVLLRRTADGDRAEAAAFADSTSASVPVKTTVSAFCDRSRRMAFSSIVPLQTAQPASRSVKRPRKSPSIPAERSDACASARSSAVTA